MSVWPSGCVCHAVRAPGSNVTITPLTRAGSLPLNGESMRTVPVNQSTGPLADGCEPILLISIYSLRFGLESPDQYDSTKHQRYTRHSQQANRMRLCDQDVEVFQEDRNNQLPRNQ